MVLKWLEARLDAAGVGDWPGLSRLVLAELILPVVVAPILAFVVIPHCQGLDKALVGVATLAVLANAAVGVARKLHTAERLHRAEAGVAGAIAAVDQASRATTAVLMALNVEIVPALEGAFAAAQAMTKDRRLSPSVRGRAAKIMKTGEGALAALQKIAATPVTPPANRRPEAGPKGLAGSRVVALPSKTLALTGPQPEQAGEPARAKPAPFLVESVFRAPRPLRVLAAEHDIDQQQLLRTLLAEAGIEPEIVSDGAQVVEAWQREPWDLILLGMQMPDMDGLAVTRSFRAAESKLGWPYTPIVALTDKPTARQLSVFAAAGIDSHLARPITAHALFDAIEATFEVSAEMGLELARVA